MYVHTRVCVGGVCVGPLAFELQVRCARVLVCAFAHLLRLLLLLLLLLRLLLLLLLLLLLFLVRRGVALARSEAASGAFVV